MQIQAELGEGHVNVIEAKEVLVTHTHLALSLEYAAGGSLTSYVADRWQHSQHAGLFLSEDEARYFFRVRAEAQCSASYRNSHGTEGLFAGSWSQSARNLFIIHRLCVLLAAAICGGCGVLP